MNITIKKHFAEEDTECISDYIDIEVFVDDELVYTAGDWYHDKGDEKVEGFIEGYIKRSGFNPDTVMIIEEDIPDRIGYGID